MPRAFCLIRNEPHYRRFAFERGLSAIGYEIHGPPHGSITRDDVLLIWNRYGRYDAMARDFETRGARVIVAENGLLGRDWRNQHWYCLALSAPAAVGGIFPAGSASRWQSWNVEICGWRNGGSEVIVLAQRGIGPPGTSQPPGWHDQIAINLRKLLPEKKVRIRDHPGERPCMPLEHDLRNAAAVVTWASGAALKALLWGIPCYYGLPRWIGASAARPLATLSQAPTWPDRATMFHALAWSTWTVEELAGGQPFERLLGSRFTA